MSKINSTVKSQSLQHLNAHSQSYKTVTELLEQLQIGSVIKGTISEITKHGHAIFTTIYGKLILQHIPSQLLVGNKLTLSVLARLKNDQLTCELTAVEGKDYASHPTLTLTPTTANSNVDSSDDSSKTTIKLPRDVLGASHTSPKSKMHEPIDIVKVQATNFGHSPIATTISYLNLSKIDQNSALYRILTNVKIEHKIECIILTNDELATYPHIIGEVTTVPSTPSEKYKIKTIFGILSLDKSPAFSLPVGKKMPLFITTINGVSVNVIKNNITHDNTIKSIASDFLFKMYNNYTALQKIHHLITNHSNIMLLHDNNTDLFFRATSDIAKAQLRQDSQSVHASNQNILEHINRDIAKLSDALRNNSFVREMSNDINTINNMLLGIPESADNTSSPWQVLLIPVAHKHISDDTDDNTHKIFVKRHLSQVVRFIIPINTQTLGALQLDGVITLDKKRPHVKAFDLAIKSKSLLSRQHQHNIAQIFSLSQQYIEATGSVTFIHVEQLIEPNVGNEV